MIPVGLRLGTQIKIAEMIGKDNAAGARSFYQVSLKMGVLYSLLLALTFWIFEFQIMSIFTTDLSIQAELKTAWISFATFICTDVLSGIAVSALVVVGKQKFGSIVTWIGYPLIAFPLIYYNTQVRGMGLTGIWIGAIAGVSFNGISFITKACLIDWQEVCVEHAARREKENESIKKIDDEQASRVEQ